jgi:hypothetical protein
MDAALADSPPASQSGSRRVVWWCLLALLVVAVVGVAVWLLMGPRYGAALPEVERTQLLAQAGLPDDFPIHPDARRARQPAQGGITYTLQQTVPEVVAWHRSSLRRSGYEIFDASLSGQDEFLPHWLHFKGRDGALGSILIRAAGRSLTSGTEVKLLSLMDARLIPPTVPANLLPRG